MNQLNQNKNSVGQSYGGNTRNNPRNANAVPSQTVHTGSATTAVPLGGGVGAGRGHVLRGNTVHQTQSIDRNLRVATWNITAINGKSSSLVTVMKEYDLDLLFITSTKKKFNKGDECFEEGGYEFLLSSDKCSNKKANSGTGIIIKTELRSSVARWIPVDKTISYIRLELVDGKFLSVFGVYAPRKPDDYKKEFLARLSDCVETLCPQSDRILICGDLNAHVGDLRTPRRSPVGLHAISSLNAQGGLLIDFCEEYGLKIASTFFKNKEIHKITWQHPKKTKSSQIDFFICSGEVQELFSNIRVYRGANVYLTKDTDHFLVIASLKVGGIRPKTPSGGVKTRIQYDRLVDENVSRDYNSFFASSLGQVITTGNVGDLDSLYSTVSSSILSAAEKACGTKTVAKPGLNRRVTVWWNSELKELTKVKREAYECWLLAKGPTTKDAFKDASKEVRRAIRRAKTEQWHKFADKLESDFCNSEKVFWSTLRHIRDGPYTAPRTIRDSDGKFLLGESACLNRWAQYFDQLLNVGLPVTIPSLNQSVDIDSPIAMSEVVSAINSIKNGKAAGLDQIRPEMVKSLNEENIKRLCEMYNMAFNSSICPKAWQRGCIIPLYKGKGDKADCSSYRGITLLSVVGKTYARILERRMSKIVEPHLDESQCGFRPRRGTADQLYSLSFIVQKAIEYGKDLYAVFIDLEKAFDSVPREALFTVCQDYGVNGKLLAAIQSLYTDSQACVRLNGSLSNSFAVKTGVRQGCVLSPLLFATYMDRVIKSCDFEGIGYGYNDVRVATLLYADDLVLLAESQTDLQEMTDKLNDSCTRLGLKINVGKTEAIVFSKEKRPCTLSIRGTVIKQVDEFKYLGSMFTADGRCDRAIDHRCAVAKKALGALWRVLKSSASLKAKLSIYKVVFRTDSNLWARKLGAYQTHVFQASST